MENDRFLFGKKVCFILYFLLIMAYFFVSKFY